MAVFAMSEFSKVKSRCRISIKCEKGDGEKSSMLSTCHKISFPESPCLLPSKFYQDESRETVIKQQIELLLSAFSRKLDTTSRHGSLFRARNGKNETDKQEKKYRRKTKHGHMEMGESSAGEGKRKKDG
ncbi:hypothetical protein AVEN_186143-1 [Araneus ventricosus]|uniref:Uncharacterized protein n=1 Tax=Araneus ventricosus TaxID=182803 RepID=A0A4Y2DVM9_ARAVE|nr:hypothetical protein AVEN_186143-1 [Araneus ventricosus]